MTKKPLNPFGSKKDFENFFRENYSPLCRFAFSHLNDFDQSEEVVQDCFYKLWNNKNSIQIYASPKSYLYSSVRNACLNVLKHEKVKEGYRLSVERQDHISEDLENEIFATELKEKILISVARMPEQRQKIFKMSRWEGMRYKEIADRLDIAYKTVENHMGLAMKFLREELKDFMVIIIFFILY